MCKSTMNSPTHPLQIKICRKKCTKGLSCKYKRENICNLKWYGSVMERLAMAICHERPKKTYKWEEKVESLGPHWYCCCWPHLNVQVLSNKHILTNYENIWIIDTVQQSTKSLYEEVMYRSEISKVHHDFIYYAALPHITTWCRSEEFLNYSYEWWRQKNWAGRQTLNKLQLYVKLTIKH